MNSSMHWNMDPTTSLLGAPLLSVGLTLHLISHLGEAMISFDYWTHSQSSIPEQRCFVDSVKWFYRTNSDNRLEVRMQEEKDEVAVVLSCTPAVFRFIPLRQPVCEGQDALFLPKQSFVTIVNTITSSVVPLTPLALVSIFLSCFLEQQTTRIRALSPDIARDLPLLLP